MTDMPQMVALLQRHGRRFGGGDRRGGAAALLGRRRSRLADGARLLAVVGALIGAISLTGSIIAWAKLDGRMDKRFTFPGQQCVQRAVFAGGDRLGVLTVYGLEQPVIIGFFVAGAGRWAC